MGVDLSPRSFGDRVGSEGPGALFPRGPNILGSGDFFVGYVRSTGRRSPRSHLEGPVMGGPGL